MMICAALGNFAGGCHPASAEDWQDFKDRFAQAGVMPILTYGGDAADNTSGGVKRAATYASDLQLQLAFDGGQLAGLPGLSGWIDALWINGGQPSKFAGDAQGVSSIAAPPALRLYEAWLQYNFAGNRYSILAGRYDLNTEFYHLVSADLFLNSSFGIGPKFGHSGFAGPSTYPDTSLGIRFAYKPGPNTVVRTAVLDAAPLDQEAGLPGPFTRHDGLLLAIEAAVLGRPANATPPDGGSGVGESNRGFRIGRATDHFAYDDKIAVGAWYYTARFNDLDATASVGAPPRHHESGAYLLVDHLLFKAADDPSRRLTPFVQLGIADPAANRFGSYFGAGLTASGIFPARPQDEAGIAMAMARNGWNYLAAQHAAALPVAAAETTIELNYLVQVVPWLAIQPDAQYVVHPNTDPRTPNAAVALLRSVLTF